MFTFATDYSISVFISTLGALQFAFSLGGLRAMLIFKSALAARTLGLALAVGGFALFFMTGCPAATDYATDFAPACRNLSDHKGGLTSPSHALHFFYGALAGLAFTLAFASAVNRDMRAPAENDDPESGIDALRETNYAVAAARGVSHWRRHWRTWTKRFSSP